MKDTSRLWAGKMAVLGLTAVGIMAFSSVSSGGGLVSPIAVPNTFKSDTPAVASEVNENFKYLVDVLNKNFEFSDEGVAIPGHITVKASTPPSPIPTIGNCPAQTKVSPTKVSGYDSAGTIIVGADGMGCEVVFGTPFAGTPVCILTSSFSHTSPLSFWEVTQEHFIFIEAGDSLNDKLKKGERVNYICIGIGK